MYGKRAFLSALIGCILLISGCGVAEGQAFSMLGYEPDESRVWADSQFFERMAERTGVSFTFQQYADLQAYQTAKDEAFASGELPDVLFKAALAPEEEMRYGESGQLVDLAPLLEEHAPNVYAILSQREDWRRIITQPDGKITSLPILNGADRQCCVWINRSWLETLGLDVPTTIDEYTEVLRAFRDGDPNGNGKADEVPLTVLGAWEAKFLLHAWGLTPNDYNIYVQDGAVRFAPFAPEYREFVQWLRTGLEEGLIDEEAFRIMQGTRSTMQSIDTDLPILYGSMVTSAPYTLVELDAALQYEVLKPLAHEGRQAYRQLFNGVGRGMFAVTEACEDVPAALRWVDFLYTEEGGRLAFGGLEGEDYTMNPDGSWAWRAQEDMQWLEEMVDHRIIAGDTVTPGLEPAAFMRNSEIVADNHVRKQTDTLMPYLVEPFPVTWPTDAARQEEIAALQEALGACVDTAIANFAMGITPLDDEGWQAFEQELRDLGAEEFVRLWQEIYDEEAARAG